MNVIKIVGFIGIGVVKVEEEYDVLIFIGEICVCEVKF